MTNIQVENQIAEAALNLFYTRGYHDTSLSDIAQSVHMSVADLKEIFEDKQNIAQKVVGLHKKNLLATFETFAENNNPRQSLSQYLDILSENSEDLIEKGCPYTALYLDLSRTEGSLKDKAAVLLKIRLDWIEEQFRIMAKVDEANDFANRLLSAIHGIIILSQATGDEHVLKSQINQLKSWIRLM